MLTAQNSFDKLQSTSASQLLLLSCLLEQSSSSSSSSNSNSLLMSNMHNQWHRQHLLRGGAKLERRTSGPGAAAAR